MLNLAENRKYPRITIDCGITYRYVEENADREGVAKNISGNGMLFVADEEPRIGDLLEVKIQPGTLSIPSLGAVVEVVRVRPGAGGAPEKGRGTACYEVAAKIHSMK
ncbi:MAG TPA: PilZ domain-containing protein [Chromatiales bacterium]|nr:PilZ domain-containing protein [Chromatiales bacterium]